jgi:hypothetical protein
VPGSSSREVWSKIIIYFRIGWTVLSVSEFRTKKEEWILMGSPQVHKPHSIKYSFWVINSMHLTSG